MKFFSRTKFKAREFNYKPRFYDANKEELERRIKIKKVSNQQREITKNRLRREFSNIKSSDSPKNRLGRSSSFRLILIIIALSVASYFVLNRWLPKMMDYWFPEENTEQYEYLDVYDESTE